jgi:hypothetical protein
MNIRFSIFDLRAAFPGEGGLKSISAHKSSIATRQFSVARA